ncbi:DNA polymerase III subunit alpha [Mycoplasma sp. U97]|uniref:DNA polymerase III subunit alpha n=1 Tax=Mycoplasma tauri TaxID=547987 RepID=UPI001CBBDBA1|nr:DNA polymerase III subunit alpha [Mycoplasma tauri]MBZ4212413.1 DNA polymerase III subunit alpha [Mycoplasma tauri]
MKNFVDLYNTTEYSFLDSLIRIQDLVSLSKENNRRAVALTDHNNMFALGEFLEQCKIHDIKPIIGVDLDVDKYRFILLAKNYDGFIKINKLIRKKSIQNLTLDDIKISDVFVLDHPISGLYAKEKNNYLADFCDYFVSSTDPSIPNSIFIKENKLFNKEDNKTLNLLQSTGNNALSKYFLNYFDNYQIDQIIIDRINKIVDECNVIFPKKELHLPNFCNSTKENQKLFNEKIQKGITKHRKELSPYKSIIIERLEKEISIISELGFVNYFLIIADLVEFANEKNISIGPGRGSASGSLVSYLLGITKINPLRYGLLFERFLNIEKVSWPDIDIDIQDDRRDEIFQYLQNKYGKERTAVISTFQTMGIKQSIRDAGRELKIDIKDINRINKSINTFINYPTVELEYKNNLSFQREMTNFPILLEHSSKIQGLPRQYGIHAAGIIISDKDLSEYVPVFENSSGFLQVQIPMEYLEEFGLLKIDLLGLKTLTEIKNIEKRLYGISLFDDLVTENPLELQDPMAINLLNKGYTEGLFQLESAGMKRTIKQVGLDSFEDLFAIISLYRPGPKDYILDYSKHRKNNSLIEKIHPDYDKIVSSTHGIIIYQEQIMQIVQSVAGMSFSQADLFRRAISKKKEDDLLKYKKSFFDGGIKNNYSEKTLSQIYEKIEKFAQYGFNKSHAVSYAYLTMKMAYYKARYPQVYYSALISNSYGDQNKISLYVNELRSLNFSVFSPNITHFTNEAIIDDGDIYLPFNLIKGFGTEGARKILQDIEQNGSFKGLSIYEILLRLRFAGLKNSTINLLIEASVFRDFGFQNQIKSINEFFENEYILLSKSNKTYNDIKQELDFEGYENAASNIISEIKYDIEQENKNEKLLLGDVYNAFKTVEYEKKYKMNLNKIEKNNGIFKAVAEIIKIREFNSKEYTLIELRDSSKSHAFFINKKVASTNVLLKVGKIIEIEVESNKKTMRLISWKGVD